MNAELNTLFNQYKAVNPDITEEMFQNTYDSFGEQYLADVSEEVKKKDQPTENGNPTLTSSMQPSQTDLTTMPNPIPDNEFLVPIGSEQDLISPSSDSTVQTPSMDLPLTDVVSSGTGSSNTNGVDKNLIRPDGTLKGKGFLGLITANSGNDMSEYSIGIEINGKETLVPTFVPTLTQEEKDYLLTEPKLDKPFKEYSEIEKRISFKAEDYAKERLAKGLPVFATKEEEGKFSIQNNTNLPTVTQPALSNVGISALPVALKDYKFYQDRISSINKEFDTIKKNPLINQNKLLVESITNLDNEYKLIQSDKEYNSLKDQAKIVTDKINEVTLKAVDGKLPTKEFNEYQSYKTQLDGIIKNPKFVEVENKQKVISDKRNELFNQYESLQNSDDFKNIVQTQSSLIEEQKSIFGSEEYKNSVSVEQKRINDYNAGLKSSANKTTQTTFTTQNINPFARDIDSPFQIGGTNLSKAESTLEVLAGKPNEGEEIEKPIISEQESKQSQEFFDKYLDKNYVDEEKAFSIQPFDTYGLSNNNQKDLVALEKSDIVEIQRDESGKPILEGNQYRYKYIDKDYYDNTYIPYIDKLQKEYKSQAQEQNIDSARFNQGNIGNVPEVTPDQEYIGELSKNGVLLDISDYEKITNQADRNEYLATAEASFNAKKNGTTFQEEYDKSISKYNIPDDVKIANGFEASNLLLGNSKWDNVKDKAEIELFENYFKDVNNVKDFGEYWNNEGKAKFGSSTIKEMQTKDQVVRATVWNDYLSYKNDKLNTNITFTDTAVQQANNRLENYLKNGDIESAMAEEAKINGFINQYNQNENEKQKLSLFAEESNKSFTEYNKLKEQEAEFQRKVENGEISANAQNILGQVVLGVESSLKSAVGGVARFVSVPFGEGNVKDAVDIFSNTELKIGNVKIAPLSQKVVEFEGFDGKKYKEVNGVTYQIGKDGELLKTTKKRQDSDKVLNEDTEYNWSGLTFMASKAITDIYITRGIEGGINRAIAGTAERIAVSKNIASVFGEGSQLAKASASFARLPRNASGASIKGWTVQMFNDSYQAGEKGGIKGDVNKFVYALAIAGVQAQLQRINPDVNFLKAINNDTQQIVRHLMTNNTQKALQSLKGVSVKIGNNIAGELPEEASQQGYQDIVNLFINNASGTSLEVTDKQGYKDLAVGTIGTSILLSLAGGGNSNVVNVNNKEIDLSNYSRNDLVTEIARDKNGLDILKNFKNESYFQSQKDFATELENEISTRSKLISKIPEVEQYSTSALSEVAPILQTIEKKKEELKNDDGTFAERIKSNIDSLTVQANTILDNDLNPNNESPNAETAQPTPQSEAVQEQTTETEQPQVATQSEQPTITGEQNVSAELNTTQDGQTTAEIESTESEVEEVGQGSQTEGNNATNQLSEVVEGNAQSENVTQEITPEEEINEDEIVLSDDIFDLINSVEDDTQTTNNITVDGNTESSVSVIQQDEQGGQENTQTVSETVDVGGSQGNVEVKQYKVNVGDGFQFDNENVDENGYVYFNSEEDALNFTREVQSKTGDFLNVEENKIDNTTEKENYQRPNQKLNKTEQDWYDRFDKAKTEGNRTEITSLYDKLRVALNGITESEALKNLKEEIEAYGKSVREQSQDTVQPTTPFSDNEQAQTVNKTESITTQDGKSFYQKEDGNWYDTNAKGGESKVTRKNRIAELDNLNKEKNVTLTKEKNGFTYKKYKDGSEEIVSSKGKIITSKIERRRNGKLRIENNPQFANQKKKIFGEKSDNEIKIEDAKRRKEALINFTPTNEREVAMLYFANGGKVSSASVNSEIVGNSESLEARGKKRKSIKEYKWVWLGKNANLTFSEVSESLVGDEIQEFDQPTLRSELIEVARSYGSSTEIAEEIVDLYNKSTDPYYGFTDEDAIAMQEAEASKAKMDFYNSVGDVYGLTDEELLDYYKQQYENSINNLTDEQQNELYTADTRTDSAQQSDKNEGNGNRDSEKQSQKSNTTSPEYQQLLKDRTEQEARVKSAKEKLDKVNKTTNTDFQADQENLFGDRATTDANALFDERANGNAGQEVIATAKREYDQARAELNRINNAIRDFENGNASGTGAIDFLFYGEKGAIQYANNEIDNLVKARIYEEQGKTPKEILDATGWFKGAEGKWRKETNHKFKFTFPDFKLGGGDVKRVKLKDVLDYPQLFKLYPRLENINLVFKNINSENYADTNGFNTITVYTDGGGISTASGNKFAHTTGAIIHEIQHLIQSDERFASGYFEGVATELLSPRFSGSGMENPLSLPLAEYERMVEKRFGKEWRNEYESGRIKSKQIGDYLYENTAGEIEAFNAQRRSQLTEEELRNELPKLLGVNPDELIKSISPVSNFFFKKPFTPIPQSTYDKLVKRLLGVFKKFGGKIITDINDYKGTDIGTDFILPNGEIYGAKFPDGTIYLNPEKINANTPIHEFSHLWQQLMPTRFKKGVELLKNTPIGKRTFAELRANEGYANKTNDELWNEALVTVMGNEGERIFNSSKTSKFKEWLVDLFKKLGDAFGIRDLSPNDKLSTFVKGALSEVMGTKEIIPESSVEQKEVPIYIRKMTNADLRTMLDRLGLVMDAVCT